MAIIYDNSVIIQGGQDTSVTFTCASNAILFAFLDLANGGAAVSAMSYGGANFGSVAGASTFCIYTWCCTAPAAGVNTFTLHLTGLFQHAVALVSYTGHDTNSPMWDTVHAQSSGTASTYNISVSATTEDLVITCVRCSSGVNAAFCNNGTTRVSGTNSTISRMIIADIVGASSITLSATVQTAAASWDSVSIPLHYGVVGGGAGAHFLMLMGVGS